MSPVRRGGGKESQTAKTIKRLQPWERRSLLRPAEGAWADESLPGDPFDSLSARNGWMRTASLGDEALQQFRVRVGELVAQWRMKDDRPAVSLTEEREYLRQLESVLDELRERAAALPPAAKAAIHEHMHRQGLPGWSDFMREELDPALKRAVGMVSVAARCLQEAERAKPACTARTVWLADALTQELVAFGASERSAPKAARELIEELQIDKAENVARYQRRKRTKGGS